MAVSIPTLLLSPVIYTLIFHLLTTKINHKQPTSTLLSQSREILSIIHCTLITILTLLGLNHHSSSIYPTPESVAKLGVPQGSNSDYYYHHHHLLPIISTKSPAMNSLMALETGYLLADSIILLRIRKAYQRLSTSTDKQTTTTTTIGNGCANPSPTIDSNTSTPPNQPFKDNLYHHHHHNNPGATTSKAHTPPLTPLLLHHLLLLLPALLLLQVYTLLGLDRGILVLASFLLMNASSPLSSLRRWLLIHHSPNRMVGGGGRALGVVVVSWTYWAVYAACRVGLVGWVLWVFGKQEMLLLLRREDGPAEVGPIKGGLESEGSLPWPWGMWDLGLRVGLAEVGFVWRVFAGLRWPCRLGTGVLWGLNAWWLGWGVWREVGRAVGRKREGTGKEDVSVSQRKSM